MVYPQLEIKHHTAPSSLACHSVTGERIRRKAVKLMGSDKDSLIGVIQREQ